MDVVPPTFFIRRARKTNALGRLPFDLQDRRLSRTLQDIVSENRHLHLSQLRDALLALHKTLVDSERAGYEQTFGPITSPNHFLKLLTEDPWFAWLHPLSRLIVSMDEALDEEESLSPDSTEALVGETRRLLVADEGKEGFPLNYFDALQRDPDVVFAHAKAASYFRPQKPSAGTA